MDVQTDDKNNDNSHANSSTFTKVRSAKNLHYKKLIVRNTSRILSTINSQAEAASARLFGIIGLETHSDCTGYTANCFAMQECISKLQKQYQGKPGTTQHCLKWYKLALDTCLPTPVGL